MKTANTQILLKDWVNALFQAIAFCLLGSVGLVGIAYAQGLADYVPSAETGTSTPSLKITFAKITGTVGDSEKTAGCVIVWLASEPSAKHIYCRYELETDANFLRDDDTGINLSDVKLYSSRNQKHFEQRIQAWFKNKPKLNLAPNELQLIAELMSSTEETFSPNSLFAKPPTHHAFVLPNSLPASNKTNAEDKKLEEYKTFAAEVHRFIPEKMAEIANKEASNAKQVAASPVTAADKEEAKVDDKAAVDKKAAGEEADVDQEAAEKKKAKEIDDKVNADTTPTDNKLSELENTIAQLWFGMILVPIVILALLWFFLAKKNTHLATELRNEISSALDEKISQLQKQQQIESKTTSQLFDKLRDELKNVRLEPVVQQITPEKQEEPAISTQASSKQESEPTPPPRQSEIKAQLALSQRIKELEQEKNRLEHDLKVAQNQLSSEQGQRENTDKALKNIRTELNKVVKLAEDEGAEKTLDSIQTGVITVIRTLRTKDTELKTLQQVLHGRFRLVKPEDTDFSHWTTALIEQQGTWRWAQLTLVGELLACETSVNKIKELGQEKAHYILELLELDNLLKHWNTLVGHLFESETKLWHDLCCTDSGKWLNRLLRASDLLQTYFKQEQPFHLLSMHLSNVAGILQAVCSEIGVQLIKPQLLEKVPDYVLEKTYMYKPHPILKQLVKPQVLEKFKTMSKFVVDIDTYGFVTADNPKLDVRVFVGSLVEWE